MKRWKKLLAGLLAMAMALSCVPGYGLEVQAEENKNLVFKDYEYSVNEDGNSITITKYTGSGSEIEILPEVDGKKVTSIGEYAFSGCSGLTSITIPSSVTNIGSYVFSSCNGLESIKIDEGNPKYYSGNSNAIIEKESNTLICGCKNTIIPSSVTSIGEGAFSDCSGLTSITIPSSVTSIELRVFFGCSGLTSIDIPDSVTSIGEGVFQDCWGLTSIDIPDSVTRIESSAFSGCSRLTSVTIPSSVAEIQEDVFWHCSDDLVIHGMTNTVAETYARDNGIKFESSGEATDISTADVILEKESYELDGNVTPPVTVKLGEEVLVLGTDYNVTYLDNHAVGTGKVIVTGRGNYTGKIEKSFQIVDTKAPFDPADWDVILEQTNYIYDGKPKTPSVTVRNNRTGEEFTLNENSQNFSVAYEENIDIGTATVIITVQFEGQQGTLTATFTISEAPEESKKTDISKATITLSQTSYTYDGKAKTPAVTVKLDGKTLVLNTDYTVSYSSNTNAGTAQATVIGKGDYTGSKTVEFTITKAAEEPQKIDISKATATLSQTSYTYDGTAKTPTVTVTLDGKTLALNTDYTVTYSNNVNVGTAKATVAGKGNYTGSKSVNFTIAKAGEQPDSKITCKKTAYKVTYGTKPFKINASSKSKMTFTSSKPKIAAVDKNTGKVTIKNTGAATITIKAGNATKKVTIKVSPKKPSVKSAKTEKGKKLIAKWAKDKMASGYQVQISTDKNFKKNVKSRNLSKTSYTFTKLKTGKKYYVRIRSYKKSGKETLYSTWSKAKLSSKIKK